MLINKKNYLFLLGLIAVLSLVGSCLANRNKASEPPMQETRGQVFGTYYTMKYAYEHPLNEEITAILNAVDLSLSLFNDQSTLACLNRNETEETDTLLREVIYRAKEISTITGGAFDATVAPLVEAWGFGTSEAHTLTDEETDSLCAFVGMDKIWFEGTWLKKADPRVQLDCGAIAKGFAVDCVARQFKRIYHIDNFMVEIGGEVITSGTNAEGHPWRIGVSKPERGGGANEIETVLQLTDAALATSGNYRNFYVTDSGTIVAHTIDPRTGKPATTDMLSATVIAKDCATADAFATAFMVMGHEETTRFLATHPELSALLIYAEPDGSIVTDEDFLQLP